MGRAGGGEKSSFGSKKKRGEERRGKERRLGRNVFYLFCCNFLLFYFVSALHSRMQCAYAGWQLYFYKYHLK